VAPPAAGKPDDPVLEIGLNDTDQWGFDRNPPILIALTADVQKPAVPNHMDIADVHAD